MKQDQWKTAAFLSRALIKLARIMIKGKPLLILVLGLLPCTLKNHTAHTPAFI
jgi:hypothetical protein